MVRLKPDTTYFAGVRSVPSVPYVVSAFRRTNSGRRIEVERHPVDAVAQPGGRRPVREHVPEVPAALAAVHLRTRHAVAAIHGGADGALGRREEARPAGAALEFPLGDEERLVTARTAERADPVLVQQRTGARRLGGVLAEHRILLWRERAAPLLVRLLNREVIGHHRLLPMIASVTLNPTAQSPCGGGPGRRASPAASAVLVALIVLVASACTRQEAPPREPP